MGVALVAVAGSTHRRRPRRDDGRASGSQRVVLLGFLGEVGIMCSLTWNFLAHKYTRYVLTDHRALHLSGVLRRTTSGSRGRRSPTCRCTARLSDRWFGTATIRIQSANEFSGFKQMTDVPNPIAFARVIEQRVSGAV